MNFSPMDVEFNEIEKIWNVLKNFEGKILVIEGIIAVGKTTFLESLFNLIEYFNRLRDSFHRKYGSKCGYVEPKKFQALFFKEKIPSKSLSLYLSDILKYAYGFQTIVGQNRITLHNEAIEFAKKGFFCIIDRGLRGDGSFAHMQHKNGIFTDQEYEAYLEIIEESKIPDPDFVLYLECTPEKSLERVSRRGNKDEIGAYTVQYLTDLRNSYDHMMKNYTGKVYRQIWGEDLRLSADNFIPRENVLSVLTSLCD